MLSVKGDSVVRQRDHQRRGKLPATVWCARSFENKERPTKPPRTTGGEHASYAARLPRRTIGASPQPGGPGTRRLAAVKLRACRRGWKRLAWLLLHAMSVGQLVGNPSTQPVVHNATSATSRLPILSGSSPARGGGDGCASHLPRPRPPRARRGRRRQSRHPNPSGRSPRRLLVRPARNRPS